MITYDTAQRSDRPLYVFLYDKLREDITAGRLRSGEKLPSKRAFARQNAVSTITVENAYAQLLAEGYLYALPRRGYFVSDLGNLQKPEGALKPARVSERPARQPAQREWFADFASNQTAPESFPFDTWARISRRVLSERKSELLTNPPAEGVWELRSAIADYLAQFRSLDILPEQVMIGAGTEYLYGLLIQLLGFDKVYASENPGYQKVARIFDAYHVRNLKIPMDAGGLSASYLARTDADVVHVTPSHHFPTGITMPVSRRIEMLNWTKNGGDRYIIEDDYDSEFRMRGRPLPPLCKMEQGGRVIYMNTFTKSLASTIRVSYMILPQPLMNTCRQKLPFYSCTVSTFEQYTLAAFLAEGYFEKHINRMRNVSRKRRDCLLKALGDSELAGRITISEENAGLHFLMNLSLEIPTKVFMERLSECGIRMISLASFMDDQMPGPENFGHLGDGNPEHTFVMNYSSVPQERIAEAVNRICSACR